MPSDLEKVAKQQQKKERAKEFADRLTATELKLGEFAKKAGFTRNVIYNLSIGQAPSSPEQAQRLADAFARLKKR